MARPKGPWPSKPPRPLDQWRHVRTQARALGAPPTVLLVLDWMCEFFALNKHLQEPVCRIGYGRHSEAERRWDRRRRRQLVEEGLARRRLIQIPNPEREGLAEKIGICRRSPIRVGQWLALHQLARVRHLDAAGKLHMHPVPVRRSGPHAEREIQMGRGGCKAGGIGLAGEWVPWSFSPPGPAPAPDLEVGQLERAVTPERMAAIREQRMAVHAGRRGRGP